jgi:uncharacterized FlaG/YvyC family protein
MLSIKVGCMDIGPVQHAGAGYGQSSVDHVNLQPGSNEAAASQRQLIQAVKAVNGAELYGQDSELTFVFDRQTHKPLVRIVNKSTREVMMQIPPEYVLRMAEEAKGTLG